MNIFLETQIVNMLKITDNFKDSCKLATIQDDGVISKKEDKQIKKIFEITNRFQKELRKIK